MKILTLAVPCYNSAEYMDKCICSLLSAGEDVEIIIVDDGSTDQTSEIADRYEKEYPTIVRAIHQENGGHGEAVNTGLSNATGLYYKVVDSDDWLGRDELAYVIAKLKDFVSKGEELDLLIANYIYEHVSDHTRKEVGYTNVFPERKIFGWDETRAFNLSQYLLMHSAIYRTELLRECGIELPKHTFYVDNLFVFQPLPYVKKMYYMNEGLYHYFIGREDQSVNEKVMMGRIDQQIRVTRLMTDVFIEFSKNYESEALWRYMLHYLSVMYTICSVFLRMDGSHAALGKLYDLWADFEEKDPENCKKVRRTPNCWGAMLPGKVGSKVMIRGYRIIRKFFKFS